MALDDGLFLSP